MSRRPESAGGRPKVLIVDDERRVLRATVRTAQRMGFDAEGFLVDCEVDQLETLGRIQSVLSEGGLVIVDQNLPVFSGMDLAMGVERANGNLWIYSGDIVVDQELPSWTNWLPEGCRALDKMQIAGELGAYARRFFPKTSVTRTMLSHDRVGGVTAHVGVPFPEDVDLLISEVSDYLHEEYGLGRIEITGIVRLLGRIFRGDFRGIEGLKRAASTYMLSHEEGSSSQQFYHDFRNRLAAICMMSKDEQSQALLALKAFLRGVDADTMEGALGVVGAAHNLMVIPTPEILSMNPEYVRQIQCLLENIFSNAKKVGATNIEIGVSEDGHKIIFQDNGTGLPVDFSMSDYLEENSAGEHNNGLRFIIAEAAKLSMGVDLVGLGEGAGAQLQLHLLEGCPIQFDESPEVETAYAQTANMSMG